MSNFLLHDMYQSAHVVAYYLNELKKSPRFHIRDDKRITITTCYKPTAAQQHAVREICKLGYSIY